jgi:DNA-binding transcriptional LysR family regulator
MDFDQLHTFLEIVRLKSFSKAAQTCYRTQPAISAQVRQLEQELRADLFERFGSKISLTTAGRIFAQYSEQMLDLRRRVQDAIAELETNPRGELVIAANEATCIYVLPRVFSEYRQLFPAVQLQVNRSYGSRVVEAVLDNSADFGLTQLPVEEKRIQVVSVLLGGGTRLFDKLGDAQIELARTRVVAASPGVTHLEFNVINQA